MQNQSTQASSIEARGLRKSFHSGGKQTHVLEDITFAAKPGEVLAILGKTGSGKTTLLNIVSALEQPDSGEISLQGPVSYAPQRDLLLPWRTVQANMNLPFEVRHSMSQTAKERIQSLLDQMGLTEFRNTYPNELSGGMRQKASLVRALAQDVPIYLFDEALSAIDFDSRLKLAHEIRSYITKNARVGLFITHNIEEAISIADRIIVLSSRPARVIYETQITIEDRDPVAIRKNPEFQRQFETLWKIMAQS